MPVVVHVCFVLHPTVELFSKTKYIDAFSKGLLLLLRVLIVEILSLYYNIDLFFLINQGIGESLRKEKT